MQKQAVCYLPDNPSPGEIQQDRIHPKKSHENILLTMFYSYPLQIRTKINHGNGHGGSVSRRGLGWDSFNRHKVVFAT